MSPRSELWEYYEKDVDSGKAVCNTCNEMISYKSTTANLKSHLRRKHNVVFSSKSSSGTQEQGNTRNRVVHVTKQKTSPSPSDTVHLTSDSESSNGGDTEYTTKWYAYKEMDELMARSKKRHVNTFWMQEAKSGDEDSSDSPPRVNLQPSASKIHNRHKIKSDSDAQTTSMYNQAIQTLKAEMTNDELTNYGMYITAHLRKFSPPMQARAKFEINKILYALDMESMGEGSTTIMSVDDNGDITVAKECKIDPLHRD